MLKQQLVIYPTTLLRYFSTPPLSYSPTSLLFTPQFCSQIFILLFLFSKKAKFGSEVFNLREEQSVSLPARIMFSMMMLTSIFKIKRIALFLHTINNNSIDYNSLFSFSTSPSFRSPGARPCDEIVHYPRAIAAGRKVGTPCMMAGMPFVLHRVRVAVARNRLSQVVDAVIYVQLPVAW